MESPPALIGIADIEDDLARRGVQRSPVFSDMSTGLPALKSRDAASGSVVSINRYGLVCLFQHTFNRFRLQRYLPGSVCFHSGDLLFINSLLHGVNVELVHVHFPDRCHFLPFFWPFAVFFFAATRAGMLGRFCAHAGTLRCKLRQPRIESPYLSHRLATGDMLMHRTGICRAEADQSIHRHNR
jgi:hypothetical protein